MFSFSQRCLLYLFFPLPAIWFRSGRQTPQPESTGAVKDQNRVGGGDHPCEVQQHHPDLGWGATRGEAADHELQRQDRKVVLCFSVCIYIYVEFFYFAFSHSAPLVPSLIFLPLHCFSSIFLQWTGLDIYLLSFITWKCIFYSMSFVHFISIYCLSLTARPDALCTVYSLPCP